MRGSARLVAALEWRERSSLAELARASDRVSKGRDALANLDVLIEAMGARASVGVGEAFSDGPCRVAELLETEQHLRCLRQELVKLAAIREQAIGELDELTQRRLQAEDRWQRSRTRLQHVQSLVRRRAVLASIRRMDADETEHADQRVCNAAMSRAERPGHGSASRALAGRGSI